MSSKNYYNKIAKGYNELYGEEQISKWDIVKKFIKFSKKEIDDYITAAKKEIVSSKSKKNLEEAVEQLAEVMKTAQDTHAPGGDRRELLKRCSAICDLVDQLMDENKEKKPAIHDLYKISEP